MNPTDTNPNRPIVWTPNETRDTRNLFFARTQDEFYLRGAVCWPFYSKKDERVRGYWVLAGMRCRDRKLFVFEEAAFYDVTHAIDSDNNLLAYGLGHWLALGWAHYGCRKYFQPASVDETWARRSRRDAMVEPRPYFVDVAIEAEAYRNVILRYIQSENVTISEGGGIYNAMDELRLRDLAYSDFAELVAMAVLLAGFEEYPWRGQDRPYDLRLQDRDWG